MNCMRKISRFFRLIGSKPSMMHVALLYRVISLLLTSLYFFITPLQSPFVFKLGIIVLLWIVAWIITDLQRRYIGNSNILQAIVLTEIIGLTVLLILTGGISSPFIWYALTPVLVAASLLTELIQVNEKLTMKNQEYEKTLEYIMSFSRLMDNSFSEKNPEKVIRETTASLMDYTQSEAAFFWLTDHHHENSYVANTTSNRNLEVDLEKDWYSIYEKKEAFNREMNNEVYLMKVIRTSDNIGVLGVKISSDSEAEKPFLFNRTFEFLAELSEIMLERIYMDRISEQMIVVEEQNRIANEIHDSVSQRLFGIVYSLHGLQAKSSNITREELNEEYQFLSQLANTTIKELRASIFRLSSVKKGDQPFVVRVKKYLDEYARLNDISIDYQMTGDESFISDKLQEALYRIICEACGNAVRHGNCTVIDLKLSFADEKTVVVIQDDGIGIHAHVHKGEREQGIGLLNMQSSVNSFDGTFSIEGISGLGTTLKIEIPTIKMPKRQEVAG